MIKKRYLVPVELKAFCDKCGTEMHLKSPALTQLFINTKINKETNQPEYNFDYICPKCGYTETLHDEYPKIEYEEKQVMSDIFQNNIF